MGGKLTVEYFKTILNAHSSEPAIPLQGLRTMDEHIHHLTKKPVACLQQWISAFSDTQKAIGELRVNHTVDCYLAIKMNKVDFYMLTYTDVQIVLWIV